MKQQCGPLLHKEATRRYRPLATKKNHELRGYMPHSKGLKEPIGFDPMKKKKTTNQEPYKKEQNERTKPRRQRMKHPKRLFSQ